MADLTCGQGGSTGAEIVARINELTKLDPRGSMRLAVEVVQQFTDDVEPIVMECFDTVVTERTGLVVDPLVGYSISNNTGHAFASAVVTVGLNIVFPGSESLEVYLYVNGIMYSDNPIVVQGDGNSKPTELFWQSDIALAVGDILDLRGRNEASGSYNCTFTRSTFRVDCDWKETLQGV